ncbi:MAG: hypothetical protein KGD67_00840 [Candidatus Lokiarchaeota archaeon]|nr:hypothetical protein [Candidatus Lokiarchaeota archaeon]
MGIKNVKIKNIYIDHYKYLGNHKNSLKIYDHPPKNMILSPFYMEFDSIDRLLSINFEEDPFYYRIELQIFNKLDNMYPLVFMYRKDDMVDIYYTNEIVIKDRQKMIKDLHSNVSYNQLEDINFNFQFDDIGLNAYLLLKDKLEKEIEFKIREKTPERELSSLLAPIGIANKKPEYFSILFLNKFGMVLKKDTEIFVKIHGNLRKATEIPVQMKKRSVYSAHFSFEPILCNWNKIFSGNINPIVLNPMIRNVIAENITYDLLKNFDYYEIKKISGKDEKDHTVSFEFSPSIPNLLTLRSNMKFKGRFSCIIDRKKGVFAGEYYITRKGSIIEFIIQPTKGWQPFPGLLWIKTFKWHSEMIIQNNKNISINTTWKRIKH